MDLSPLSGWDNFYVIAGSAAAGLTGLTFVVITLSAGARRVSVTGLRVFLTPTIVHFGAVLAIAAYVSMPRQSELSLSLGLGAAGAVGLVYIGALTAAMHLLAVGLLVWRWPQQCMYGAATVVVLLMIIGIHNAWDIAVWNTIRPPADPK